MGYQLRVPWLIFLDFNQILSESEKLGGTQGLRRTAGSLWSLLEDNDLFIWEFLEPD